MKYTFWKNGREDAVNPGWSVVKGPGANSAANIVAVIGNGLNEKRNG